MDLKQPPSRRILLNRELVKLLGVEKSVHYTAPTDVKLKYPCIIYNLDDVHSRFSNNRLYKKRQEYKVTHISYSADDSDRMMDLILDLPYTAFRTRFVSDGLYHSVYSIYY